MPQERPEYDVYGGTRFGETVRFEDVLHVLTRYIAGKESPPSDAEIQAWVDTCVDKAGDVEPGDMVYRDVFGDGNCDRLIVLEVDEERNRIRAWVEGKRCYWYDLDDEILHRMPLDEFVRDQRRLTSPPLRAGVVYRWSASDPARSGLSAQSDLDALRDPVIVPSVDASEDDSDV